MAERAEPGIVERLEPGLRRILAPNPSAMTERGTNTYILGEGRVAVIDPGPEDAAHLRALLDAVSGERVSHILVTHAHRDHSALAAPLARATGAPVFAFGDAGAGRSEAMRRLAARGLSGGGEGVDAGFVPDEIVADGAAIEGDGWRLEALWTPGHFGNHLCFGWGDRWFTGDLAMGWSSSLISPPDGDVTQFMASCERLAARLSPGRAQVLHAGHGAPVRDPSGRLAWLLDHRRGREAQILAALGEGPATLPALARRVYADLAPALLPAAERNVLAHLVDLHGRDLATARPDLDAGATFAAR